MEAKHDVLIVGAGCAGMRAAIEAHDEGADVALISKIHPVRSHSGAAEGGINAALGNASEDDPEKHAFDTVKGSDYLGDQDAIQDLDDDAEGEDDEGEDLFGDTLQVYVFSLRMRHTINDADAFTL